MTVFAASIIIVVVVSDSLCTRSQDLLYLLAKWRAVGGAGSVGVALCAPPGTGIACDVEGRLEYW